jgi:hypothetical protein
MSERVDARLKDKFGASQSTRTPEGDSRVAKKYFAFKIMWLPPRHGRIRLP